MGGVWLVLADDLPENLGISQAAMAYYYIFSAIALVSAVRVITHTKPVYAALWFVMTVLACSGLLLATGAPVTPIRLRPWYDTARVDQITAAKVVERVAPSR